MHEPGTVSEKRFVPGKGAGANAQQMPIRAGVETIVLPPQKVMRTFTAGGDTGLGIAENHALVIVSDVSVKLVLSNPGDEPWTLALNAGYRRIITQVQIQKVNIAALGAGGTATLWVEDLRAMEPWICAGEYRP